MSHIAQNSKDDKTSEEAGGAVHSTGEERVPVDIVVELVITGKGEKNAKARSEREEDLSGGIDPNVGVVKSIEVWCEVILDAI